MENKINLISTFQNDYENDNFSAPKIFLYKYNKPFNLIKMFISIDTNEIFDFLKKKFKNKKIEIFTDTEIFQYQKNKKNKRTTHQLIIEIPSEEIIVETDQTSIYFYYADLSKKQKILNIIEQLKAKPKKKKHLNNFYMITKTHFGLDLKKFKVKETKVSVEDNYNDDFVVVNNEIFNFIDDENKNGIVMLHGKFGTGKTTYIRYLAQKSNKKFIYLPLHLISSISSPDLVDFFANNKNSILILEDCEELIKPRGTNIYNTDALVNLLNLGDGLLNDAFSVKIICTFNAELKAIDPAILRKGRLAIRYEFMPLEIEKAKKLAKKLNISTDISQPTTIAEIYNTNQIAAKFEKSKKIGF